MYISKKETGNLLATRKKKSRPPNTHYGHSLADPDTSGQAVHLDGLLPYSLSPSADGQRRLQQMEHPGYRVRQMHINLVVILKKK